jgi:trimethylamine---corrinoid protein Co-methyltransferase
MADAGAAVENTLTGLMHAASRVSIVWGVGSLESTKCMSLEMAVIGNDLAGALRRMQQGIRVDDQSLALDLIQQMGQRAQYLEHPHTLENFRNEYYYPHVLNRRPRGKWQSLGARTAVEEASARVESLRALPLRTVTTDAQRYELAAIERRWRSTLTV